MPHIKQMKITDFGDGQFWAGSREKSKTRLKNLTSGIIVDSNGKVFLVGTHGFSTLAFPILADGRVSRSGSSNLHPLHDVYILDPKAVEIQTCKQPDGEKCIVWTDDYTNG